MVCCAFVHAATPRHYLYFVFLSNENKTYRVDGWDDILASFFVVDWCFV